MLGCAWDRVGNREKGPSSISVSLLRCLPPSLPSDTGKWDIIEPKTKANQNDTREKQDLFMQGSGAGQPRHRQTNLIDPEPQGQSHTYTELPALGDTN